MEKFLIECGACSVRNLSTDAIVKLSGDLAERNMVVALANSRTGLVFKITQTEVKPEKYGRFRIEMGSITGGGTDAMDNFFCDSIRFEGGEELIVNMTSGDRIVGSLNADYIFNEAAFTKLGVLYVKYLSKDNSTRLLMEELESYYVGIKTGKLEGFSLMCSGYALDSAWKFSVDFGTGMSGFSKRDMTIVHHRKLDKNQLKELFTALKDEKYMKGRKPAEILDGDWYELTLNYKTMKRKIEWNSGNDPSHFVELVEKLVETFP